MVKDMIEAERKNRGIPLEAKFLNVNYYLHRYTSRYDRNTKKAVNVSEYI